MSTDQANEGPQAATEEAPLSPRTHPSFYRLWAGQAVSGLGTQVTTIALPLIAVIWLEASATQVGMMNAARDLAFLGLMLFFGVLVDRMRRRPLMIASDLGRAFFVGLVPLLAFLGMLSMEVLYVVAFAVGSLTVVYDLAYRSYLPTLLPAGLLASGNQRLQATESIADVAGPSVGGWFVQLLRGPYALLVDFFSYIFSASMLMRIDVEEPAIERSPDDQAKKGVKGVFTDIFAGLRTTLSNPVLWPLAGTSATFNFFSQIQLTIFVVYAVRVLDMSPFAIGTVFAFFGVGGVLGAITFGKVMPVFGYGRFLVATYALAAFAIVALPFVGGSQLVVSALLATIYLGVGYGIVGSGIAEMTFRQLAIPNELLGRVNASFRFLIGALLPVSAAIAGVMGDALGLRTTLFIVSAGIPFSLLWLLCSRIPHLSDIEHIQQQA